MKKVLAIFLAFIIGLSMSAQIQNKLLGFTLGSTTKSEVYNKYKNEELFTANGDDIGVGDLKFAGQTWDVTIFRFYNNKLMLVQFSVTDGMSPLSAIETVWESFKQKLMKKYDTYYLYSSTSDFLSFSDNITHLSLSRFVYGTGVNLLYYDIALADQQSVEEEGEL